MDTTEIPRLEDLSCGDVILLSKKGNRNVQDEPNIITTDLQERGIWIERLYPPQEPDKNLIGHSVRISHDDFGDYKIKRVDDESFKSWKYAHQGIKAIE